MAKAVIWDWDGVIADSAATYFMLYQEVCGRFGKCLPPATLEEFRAWYQPRWEENYVSMGFSADELREALHYSGQRVRGLREYLEVRLFEGALQAVRMLSREFPMAIASTTHSELIRRRLREENLEECFTFIIGGEGGGSDKLHHYRKAAEALAVPPQEAVAVGDTAHDVESARHWGMGTVGVTYGWSTPHRIVAAHPDRLVHDPTDLEPTLRGLLEAKRG